MDMFILLLALISVLGLIAGFIYGLYYLVKDTKATGQNSPLWVILFILFGYPVLAVYMFINKKTMAGIFWLLAPFIPVFMFVFALFSIML